MGQTEATRTFSAFDYLAWESGELDHHEYLNGEVLAMAGADDRHVTVSENLYIALRQHATGSPCRTFMSDMRLHVVAANACLYPDVLMTYSAFGHDSALQKTEPKLIVEVLSSSTAAYDRGVKFSHYRSLASLEEYVLIDLDSRSTDCYRKGSDELCVLHPFARAAPVHLTSDTLELTAERLFAEVPER